MRSRITEETEEICFAVLHLGDQNLSAAVKRFRPGDETSWNTFLKGARTAVRKADLAEFIRLTDRFFGGTLYSLTSLFADEQHRILTSILNQTLEQVETSLIRIYEEHATLRKFLFIEQRRRPACTRPHRNLYIIAFAARFLDSG